jgi:hypothetical protein
VPLVFLFCPFSVSEVRAFLFSVVSPVCSGSAGLIRWLLLDLGVLSVFGELLVVPLVFVTNGSEFFSVFSAAFAAEQVPPGFSFAPPGPCLRISIWFCIPLLALPLGAYFLAVSVFASAVECSARNSADPFFLLLFLRKVFLAASFLVLLQNLVALPGVQRFAAEGFYFLLAGEGHD